MPDEIPEIISLLYLVIQKWIMFGNRFTCRWSKWGERRTVRYLALLSDISYSTTRNLLTLLFLIQCSTKLSVALTQLQGTRDKTYITNAKDLSGEMDLLPWSPTWNLGHLFLHPETLLFLYVLFFDCETCQTHSGLTNWLWNRYWLERELNRNSFYLNYNGIEKYFAKLSGAGFTSYHWNKNHTAIGPQGVFTLQVMVKIINTMMLMLLTE